jgi:hypothetical protein
VRKKSPPCIRTVLTYKYLFVWAVVLELLGLRARLAPDLSDANETIKVTTESPRLEDVAVSGRIRDH